SYNPLALSPHQTAYLLWVTYNAPPQRDPWRERLGEGRTADQPEGLEAKVQISPDAALQDGSLTPELILAFAYTQQSYWQLYNSSASRPFRETVHEPELFLSLLTDFDVLGWRPRIFRLGVVHQSNGQSDPLSRSWNRIYGQFILERKRLVVGIRAWYRIQEETSKDDNPDIHQYLGYGDIRLTYYLDQHELSL